MPPMQLTEATSDAARSAQILKAAVTLLPGTTEAGIAEDGPRAGDALLFVKGKGALVTDADGRYRFTTIRPGCYPLPHGDNSWRPAHIHFSVFGHGFVQRLITQMYFEGDPLIWRCPIVRTIPARRAVELLVAPLDRLYWWRGRADAKVGRLRPSS